MENYSEILDIDKTVDIKLTKMTENFLPLYTHIGRCPGNIRNYKRCSDIFEDFY